jgi:hypothetical protein
MLDRQMAIRQDVFGGVLEQRGRARKPAAQALGDLAQLVNAEA